jgi:hypothetical protein
MSYHDQAQQIEDACRQLQRTKTQQWARPEDRQTARQQLKACVEAAEQPLRLPHMGDHGGRQQLILWHELGRGTLRELESGSDEVTTTSKHPK